MIRHLNIIICLAPCSCAPSPLLHPWLAGSGGTCVGFEVYQVARDGLRILIVEEALQALPPRGVLGGVAAHRRRHVGAVAPRCQLYLCSGRAACCCEQRLGPGHCGGTTERYFTEKNLRARVGKELAQVGAGKLLCNSVRRRRCRWNVGERGMRRGERHHLVLHARAGQKSQYGNDNQYQYWYPGTRHLSSYVLNLFTWGFQLFNCPRATRVGGYSID